MGKTLKEKKNVKGNGSRPSSRERWMLVGAKRGNLIGSEYIEIKDART